MLPNSDSTFLAILSIFIITVAETSNDDFLEFTLWLQNNSLPWTTVIEYWKKTLKQRQILLKELDIDAYFKKFPALLKDNGYELVCQYFIPYTYIKNNVNLIPF